MNLPTKSIAYFLISKGFNIFTTGEDDIFLVHHHICSKCDAPWYMNITECILCGANNPYLLFCRKCEQWSSITGVSKECRCGTTFVQACINENCISNTDKDISSTIDNKYNGVFGKGSCFQIAQNHCSKCGSTLNKYISFKTKIYESSEIEKINEVLVKVKGDDFDILIIKYSGKHPQRYATVGRNEIPAKLDSSQHKEYIDISKFT